MRKATLLTGLALLVVLAVVPTEVATAQCAMCRATVESNAQSGNTDAASGLNTGILYLMSLPYIIFATIGFLWYRSSQRKKAERAAQAKARAALRAATGLAT